MEAKALFCGGDGVLERKLRRDMVGEEGDELVSFAMAEGGSIRRGWQNELFKMRGDARSGEDSEEKDGSG